MVKLTQEYVFQKCKVESLSKVKKLDVWSNDLSDVSLVQNMPNIEICSLSLNKLTSLSYFQNC